MINKKWIHALLLLSGLSLLMIINETSYAVTGHRGMNFEKSKYQCSWACHEQTAFCTANHLSYIKPYLQYTDPIYSGIIKNLKSTGNYRLANLIVLAILVPGLIYFLLYQNVKIALQIRQLKKIQRNNE